jgi:hypothetical protein
LFFKPGYILAKPRTIGLNVAISKKKFPKKSFGQGTAPFLGNSQGAKFHHQKKKGLTI